MRNRLRICPTSRRNRWDCRSQRWTVCCRRASNLSSRSRKRCFFSKPLLVIAGERTKLYLCAEFGSGLNTPPFLGSARPRSGRHSWCCDAEKLCSSPPPCTGCYMYLKQTWCHCWYRSLFRLRVFKRTEKRKNTNKLLTAKWKKKSAEMKDGFLFLWLLAILSINCER